MAHSLERITRKLKDTPHLISVQGLEQLEDYLNARNGGESVAQQELRILQQERARGFYNADNVTVENGMAVIDIDGSLSYQFSGIAALCGLTTYQGLKANVEAALQKGAHTIVFDVDSPGGEAYACFETASAIRAMADEAGAKIISYVDGMAASAAYALVSVSDEIIANPMAEVGSIGVVVSLSNPLPKMIKDGYEKIFVSAGKSKIPFEKDGTFKEEFINELQGKVDDLYLEFIDHVSTYRDMTDEKIMNTEAKTFVSNKALDLGLIDTVMNHEEFSEYLAGLSEHKDNSMPLFKRNKDKETLSTPSEASEDINLEESSSSEANLENEGQEEMTDTVTMEELQAQLEEAKAQAAAAAEAQAELTEMKAKAKAAKLDAMTAELSQYSFINEDNAASLASFLMENEGSEIVTALTASLDAAKDAIEASLDVQVGDEGEPQPEDQLAAEKAAQKKAAAARYNK